MSVARQGGGPFPDPKRPQGATLGRGRPATLASSLPTAPPSNKFETTSGSDDSPPALGERDAGSSRGVALTSGENQVRDAGRSEDLLLP
jgi:hypothetical protein